MRPIAIFQFSPNVEPGYFASFLDAKSIPAEIVRIDQGEPVPDTPNAYSGVCLMGGAMSVNDPLPWIPSILSLIRQAVDADIPVIGHCLGGQLLARALGGTVARNTVAEIGWGQINAAETPLARDWLGPVTSFSGYHWHRDIFSLPRGATCIMSSAASPNQGFVIGPHLGMQCHVEMTDHLIASWNALWHEQTTQASPSIQPSAQQLAQIHTNLPVMREIAHHLYEKWLENVQIESSTGVS